MPANASHGGPAIQRLHAVTDAQLQGLAALLIDCVAAQVAQGKRALLVAEDAHGVVGTVQLILDQPENQPHRADLSKMLVHRRGRRRGWGGALLRAAENLGRDCGKSLLVLDTASGDAERLYARSGWQRCGVIPGYALLPRGGLCDTTYFYRILT
jgi:GNAT superfamily N-acetyltransferase